MYGSDVRTGMHGHCSEMPISVGATVYHGYTACIRKSTPPGGRCLGHNFPVVFNRGIDGVDSFQ